MGMVCLKLELRDPAEQFPDLTVVMDGLLPRCMMFPAEVYFQSFRLCDLPPAGPVEDVMLLCIFLPVISMHTYTEIADSFLGFKDALLVFPALLFP